MGMFLWVFCKVLLGQCLKTFLLQKVPPKVRRFIPAPLEHNSPSCHQLCVISFPPPQNKAALKAPLPWTISLVNNWYFSLYLGNLPPGLFSITPTSWFSSLMDRYFGAWLCRPATFHPLLHRHVLHNCLQWFGKNGHQCPAMVYRSEREMHSCPKAFLLMVFLPIWLLNPNSLFPVALGLVHCDGYQSWEVLSCPLQPWWAERSRERTERKGSSWH